MIKKKEPRNGGLTEEKKMVMPPQSQETPLKAGVDENNNIHLTGNDSLNNIAGTKDNEIALSIYSMGVAALLSVADSLSKNDNEKLSRAANVILQSLNDQKPKDAVEARLVVQAAVLFEHGMSRLTKAGYSTDGQISESQVGMASKLLRLANETIENLRRYRQGDSQKIVVQHVHISGEAKAIVGDINLMGGGGMDNSSIEPLGSL